MFGPEHGVGGTLDEIIRVIVRSGCHRQHIPGLHIHYHHGPARISPIQQRGFGRFLDVEIDGQHHIVPRHRRQGDGFAHAKALVVYEFGLAARDTAQFLVEHAFDARDAGIILKPIIVFRRFPFAGIVIVSQVSEEMGG